MIIQGVDPGQGFGLGRSLFDGSKLVACGFWDIDSATATRRAAWTCDKAIIEIPQIYPRLKGDPNDLITVAAIAGRARQAIGWNKGEFIWPNKWKGNVNAETMLIRIVQALTEAEREVYFRATDCIAAGYRHNVIDAIGLGLFKLNRLPR